MSVDGNEDSGTPGRGQLVSSAAQDAEIDAFGCHETAVAYQHALAVDLCLGSMTGNVAERGCRHLGGSSLIGMASDGLGQWMLRFAFNRGGERQQLIFIKA